MGTRVYLGRLPRDVRSKDIYNFFREFKIEEVTLKNGYGFVEFSDSRDADDAVEDYDGKVINGEKIRVEHSRGGTQERRPKKNPPTRSEYRVIVENLSSRASWQDLKDFMRKGGEVCYADIRNGEGIVEFESEDDMKKAIRKLDGDEFKGKKVKIREDSRRNRSRTPPRRRKRSRSRSRSRSKSRSRSRSRSKSRSKSRSRSRSKSRSRSNSRKRKESRSKSRSKSRSRSRTRSKKDKDRERDRDKDKEKERRSDKKDESDNEKEERGEKDNRGDENGNSKNESDNEREKEGNQ